MHNVIHHVPRTRGHVNAGRPVSCKETRRFLCPCSRSPMKAATVASGPRGQGAAGVLVTANMLGKLPQLAIPSRRFERSRREIVSHILNQECPNSHPRQLPWPFEPDARRSSGKPEP